jgi:hypothetical protein
MKPKNTSGSFSQLNLGFEIQSLPSVALPSTNFEIMEQLAIALQNRDEIGLRQLIDDSEVSEDFGGKDKFVSKFINYCNKMDKKHKGVYVHTVPGSCQSKHCNGGRPGLGVTLNTIRGNKLLWKFNIIAREVSDFRVKIQLCIGFAVNHKEIPF